MVTKPLALAIKEIQGVEIVTLDTLDKTQNILGIYITLNNINNLQATHKLIIP